MSLNWQGKVWGKTAEVCKAECFSVHYLFIKKGGYCSEHFHQAKWNTFFVIKGKLLVEIFRDEGSDKTILKDHEASEVPPRTWHKFTALEDTLAIELYRVALEGEDIKRRTRGGAK